MNSRVLSWLGFGTVCLAAGCAGFLSPAGHPARVQLKCRAAVLEPYLADAAEQAVVQIQGGGLSPVQLLLGLGLSPAEVMDVATRYQACGGAAPEAEVPVSGVTLT